MRNTSRISIFLFFALTIALPAIAQQTRVAYIDADKLLKRMPEVKDADARLDQLQASWTKEATEMQGEIDRKQSEYDRRKLIMTDAERNAAELDLTNLKKKRNDFLNSKFDQTGGELFSQEATLMKPAYDRLSSAIKECAADGNYDYVIDRSSKDVVLLFVNSKFDLTLPVARKLGIESAILSTPLVNAKPGAPQTPPQPGTTAGTTPGTIPGTMPGSTSQPGFQIPGTPPANGSGTTPNGGTTPGSNTGGLNPGQVPQTPPQPPPTGH